MPQLRRHRPHRARRRRRLIARALRALVSGTLASVASALAGLACSRVENRHAARSMNAVAHIYDGGAPRSSDGGRGRNAWLGFGIHTVASLWWALVNERLRNPPASAALGYLVDYHVVPKRLRPGFEAHLSATSMVIVYASLAAGFALADWLNRRFHDHEKKDGDERDERGPAEGRPNLVVSPEARR
jgi:hypothetical protein